MDEYLPMGYRWANPDDNEAIVDGNASTLRVPVERSGYGHAEMLKRLAIKE